ncbi:MAG: TatD family hydrolase [Bacteroidales bacterium]|nr:TatD family hydrolase [Bacteroidales bacterium]
MKYIDSHTHLYAGEFDADREAVVQRAVHSGVSHLLLPAIDSLYHKKLLDVVTHHPQLCYPMMGLHPTSVRENYRDELTTVEKWLATPALKFYALGEIGIDLYWDKTFDQEQRIVFKEQLRMAINHDLPAVIHTRNSMEIVLEIVEKENNSLLRGVFHCFNGNLDQARRAISLGFYLGIGGVVTYKNSGLQKIIETISPVHLLLETDAPWLPPVPYRGKRNESSYLPLIAQKIAEITNVSLETVAEITTRNAKNLFKIS